MSINVNGSVTPAMVPSRPNEIDGIPISAWTALQVVHTLLTVLALVANCTSLGVIYGIVSRLTPTLQVLTSLSFADMLAPWAVMTVYFPTSACQDEIHTALLLTSHNATALSLTVLAVCHAVATFQPLSYERVATQRRIWIGVNLLWIVAIVLAHVHFLAVLTHFNPELSYCEQVGQSYNLPLMMSVTLTGTQVFVGGCIYARVLLSLRPLQSFSPETGTTNPPKSIRGVITGMLLNITYLICWLPWIITRFCTLTSDPQSRTPDDITDLQIGLKACQVLILLNALCNPLIYGSRMITMQTAYLTLYHRIRGRIRVTWHKCLGKDFFGDDLPSTPLNPIESIC